MSPPEPSHLTTALSEHSNIPEAQGKDLKTNFMKTEVFKEEINKPLKEFEGKNETKNWEEINKFLLQKIQGKNPNKLLMETNKTVQLLKLDIETIKKSQREFWE